MNIGIIITARVKSSRIPNKVLQQIGNKRAIEILIDNVLNNKYDVILAIPESEENDILKEIGENKGIFVYRGQDDSPMHRLYECGRYYKFDYIVRITADDIFIDLESLFNQVRFALNKEHDYVYMTRCVEGSAGEVIKFTALEQAIQRVGKDNIEFVSYYLKGEEFRIKEYFPPFEKQHTFRCVMDYPEDLLFIRVLFACLPEPIKVLDIIHFLKKHKYLLRINHLPEVTVYSCNYNNSKYIIDAIQSVIDQTFEDWEYIILDDCSTDNSIEKVIEFYTKIPLEYQKKIKVLKNDTNLGLSASSNHCLANSRGRYIVRLDPDDTLESDFLKEAINELRLSDKDAIITGYYECNETLEKKKKISTNKWHPACALLSKKVCNSIKYKDGIKFLDGDLFYDTWRKNYSITFNRKPLWNYRQHEGQKTKDPDHPRNKK